MKISAQTMSESEFLAVVVAKAPYWATVATSSSSVVNARWGSSTPLPDFPLSGNHFPISEILLISGYREIISRYRKMRFISRYRKLFPDIGYLNSRYQKKFIFPDIRNSNSRYREIISRYREFEFPISANNFLYREMMNKNPNVRKRICTCVQKRTEAYIRHWLMGYYLDLVKLIAQYEVIIAWYEIIKTCYAKIITLYAILQRNNAIFITRNAIIKF